MLVTGFNIFSMISCQRLDFLAYPVRGPFKLQAQILDTLKQSGVTDGKI